MDDRSPVNSASATRGNGDANEEGKHPAELQSGALDGFKLKPASMSGASQRTTEELKFSRKHRESSIAQGEKRVWVVSPGE